MTGNATTSPSPPPKRERWLIVLRETCRFIVAAVFLMAALTKITDLAAFEDQIVLHAHLRRWLEVAVIYTLPWLELSCGIFLALGYGAREAAAVACILLGAFLAHGLLQPAETDCGCFLFPSLLAAAPPWWQPLRNALLIAACLPVIAGRGR